MQLGVMCCVNQVLSALLSYKAGEPFMLYSAWGVHWFLICLLFWRVTLPFWMVLRWPLTVSLILGMLANFTDTMNTYFHSFLCFLPFFIAGHLVRRAGGQKVLDRYRRPSWCIGLLGVLLLAYLQHFRDDGEMAFGTTVIAQMITTYSCLMSKTHSCETWLSIPFSFAYYLLAVPLIPALLHLIPRGRVWGLTRAGQSSMDIYLLHVCFIVPWKSASQHLHGGFYILGAVFYAFVVWGLLGTGCVRPCFMRCIDPKVDWFIKPEVSLRWQRADAEGTVSDAAASTITEQESPSAEIECDSV